ncbi:nucleoside phosphatase family-domain-containing protein [Mycena floridula]|nr:nucleoside phosphatase family-domain-containing protein [Mycena floridula]
MHPEKPKPRDVDDKLSPPDPNTEEVIPMIISPIGSNYDRLENAWTWKKFGIGAAVLIALVWFFGPRETCWSTKEEPKLPTPPATKLIDHPISFETDKNPSKTTHCTVAHFSAPRLVQYALMIDAGSTGSRIHIYKFNNCGPSPAYEYEVFKQVHPSLSSYAGNPLEAAKSLDVLLDEALRVVPESLRKCSPVAVKASAGLRMLPRSNEILAAVKKRLQESYPFPIEAKDGVVFMEGKDAGVYAWITANYLLGTIGAEAETQSTYAVLDLGGGSTQIVFEPKFGKPDSSLADGDHKYDLGFQGQHHVLYQHLYVGYGLMMARGHVHQLVDSMDSIRGAGNRERIGNPCIAQGTTRLVRIQDERSGSRRNVIMDGETVGNFDSCRRIVERVMAKDPICEKKPCSFNGVYQPSLLDALPTGNILLLSYFYDRLAPLLPPVKAGVPRTTLPIKEIATLAKDICHGPATWKSRWGKDHKLMKELEERPEWCLDLTLMYGLLTLGYEFREEQEVTIGKKIQGTELGWCLGATIAMVAGELTYRV